MASNFLKALTALSILGLTSGCVAGPTGNQMNIDNDGGGRFSGNAGMEWTQQEIATMVGAQVCGGTPPRTLNVQVLSGSWLFSGTC